MDRLNLKRKSAIQIAWKAFTDEEEPEKSGVGDVDDLVDLYFQMMREGINCLLYTSELPTTPYV